MIGTSTYKCFACTKDYVLNYAEDTCVSNKGGDALCWKLNNLADNCEMCWWPFYFHDRICAKTEWLRHANAFYVFLLLALVGVFWYDF